MYQIAKELLSFKGTFPSNSSTSKTKKTLINFINNMKNFSPSNLRIFVYAIKIIYLCKKSKEDGVKLLISKSVLFIMLYSYP